MTTGEDRALHAGTRRGNRLHVLGLTKDGHPKHPLYLPGDLEPRPWEPVAA
jgi:hypothetical protein